MAFLLRVQMGMHNLATHGNLPAHFPHPLLLYGAPLDFWNVPRTPPTPDRVSLNLKHIRIYHANHYPTT